MKNWILFLCVLMSSSAWSADRGLGLGFILGNPSAVSVKWFASAERAYDLQVSVTGKDFVAVWGDFLFQTQGLFGRKEGVLAQIESYVGVGPLMAIATKSNHDKGDYFDERDDDFALGVRIPFGLEWFWKKAPLALGVEVVPSLVVAPATQGLLQAGATFRYYF